MNRTGLFLLNIGMAIAAVAIFIVNPALGVIAAVVAAIVALKLGRQRAA